LSFGPHMRYPELRRQHEIEGARIAGEILVNCGYDRALIDQITVIIDGHDTRKQTLSLNDSVLRDADKLWAYTPIGMGMVRDWFDYSGSQYIDMLTKWLDTRFYTEAGGHMARGLLAALLANVFSDLSEVL
ncbi:MAG: phosphohydrolase, partial [Chloroflexota bacterium]